MNEIFNHAKSILVVWVDDAEQETLSKFQESIERKARQAHIAFESISKLLESRRVTSSFDIILFDLVSKIDTPPNLDLLNEFFRLLHPNGYLITHIEYSCQIQVLDHLKMCGFSNCNPLNFHSSFLIQDKTDDIKRRGSLWLCQKPTFEIGYSVPLRKSGVSLLRQISTTGGGRKTWTIEVDDDDDDDDNLITTNTLFDTNDRRKHDVQNHDYCKKSIDVRKSCKTCTSGLGKAIADEEHEKAQQNTCCGNCYLDDVTRWDGCRARDLPPLKPSEHVFLPVESDV